MYYGQINIFLIPILMYNIIWCCYDLLSFQLPVAIAFLSMTGSNWFDTVNFTAVYW